MAVLDRAGFAAMVAGPMAASVVAVALTLTICCHLIERTCS
jgi:hypothetical protein